jgi:hypothetical protein
VHYWNVTPGGVELDLTRDQFMPAESLINQRRVTTGRNSSAAGEQPFQRLRERVTAALARSRRRTRRGVGLAETAAAETATLRDAKKDVE